MTGIHTLRAGGLEADIDLGSGALVRLRHVDRGWDILPRPELGRSFVLMVPFGRRRNNRVEGLAQSAPATTVSADGATVTCHWPTVHSQHAGEHQIGVTTTITATRFGLTFSIELDNRSDLVVEDIQFPFLGEVAAPETGRLEAFTFGYGTALTSRFWPEFDSAVGYYGIYHPTYFPRIPLGEAGPPASPFILLRDDLGGLYAGIAERDPRLLTWWAQLVPGWGESISAENPTGPTAEGKPVAVEFAPSHVAFVGPGTSTRLTPITLAAFTGGWQPGADHYVAARQEWGLDEPERPVWTEQPHSWLQLHVNSPEGEFKFGFDELPSFAAECAAHGVSAIQLVGWNEGGQDQNNPSHDPDPMLGGAEKLRDAIRACQDLGVRIVLFSKFTWADRATERFRNELIADATKDPYGDYYQYSGYPYQTVTQLLDINTKRLIPMCFGSQHYRDVAAEEFQKIIDLGADGHLYDEGQHHTPALLCFDPNHGHAVPDPVYSHDLEFAAHLKRQAPQHRDGFLHAVEGAYDWEFAEYGLSYFRSKSVDHVPLARYLRPNAPIMTAVTGFGGDRNLLNQCLMYRYVISYEPYNFKGRLSDFPDTVAYGTAVDALRTLLRPWLWDGRFRDRVGADVTCADGTAHHPYAVFEGADGAGTAVVVCNYDTEPVRVRIASSTALAGRTVDNPVWLDASGVIEIPARSAFVAIPAAAQQALQEV